MIGIMAAMDEELHRIVAMLVDGEEQMVGRKLTYLGKLNNKNVVVVFSGWGKVASASTATMLIERYSITQLIFTGVAGGVASHINIGDIVIGENFVQHDMDCAGVLGIKRFEIPLLSLTEIPATQSLQRQAEKASQNYLNNNLANDVLAKDLKNLGISQPTVYSGLIASGDQFISSNEKQQALLSEFPELLAIEMEGAAVAQVAYEYDLPFVVFVGLF
jgi:adenosylhomocysteine nucleosidase